MLLGLGFYEDDLLSPTCATSHQKNIKRQVELIYSVWIMIDSCLCESFILLRDVLQLLGDVPQFLPSPFFFLPFIFFVGIGEYKDNTMISYSYHSYCSHHFQKIQAPMNPKLHLRSQPILCLMLGVLPTVLSSMFEW